MPPDAIPASSNFPWSLFGQVCILVALVLASFLSGGCTSISRQLDALPARSAAELHYTRTGKFSSTTITAKGYNNDGEVTYVEDLTIRHSNAWMPNLEIVAKGYRRIHEAKKGAAQPSPAETVSQPPSAPAAVLEVKPSN